MGWPFPYKGASPRFDDLRAPRFEAMAMLKHTASFCPNGRGQLLTPQSKNILLNCYYLDADTLAY